MRWPCAVEASSEGEAFPEVPWGWCGREVLGSSEGSLSVASLGIRGAVGSLAEARLSAVSSTLTMLSTRRMRRRWRSFCGGESRHGIFLEDEGQLGDPENEHWFARIWMFIP